MNKKYKFTISASKASRLAHVDKTIEVTQGTTTHIVAKGGERFQIQELTTGFAPKKIGVKRVGNDLHIQFEAGTQPDVIIENYYDSGVLPNELGGINEEHQLFDYLVADAQDTFGMVELGGTSTAESVVGSGGVMETLGDWVWPLGLAVAAGGAGAAFGMGGGGGGKSAAKIATPKSAALIEEDTVDALTQKPTNTPNIFIQSPPKGMRAQLLVDGVEVEATLHQAADGRYYFVPSQALSEGQHTLTYHFVTAAGKAGANSPASIALIDTLVLDTPSTSPSIVGTGGTQTNQTTPTISLGKIQQGATPHLLVDGQDVPVTVSTDANGNVSITPTSPLSEGAHSIAYVYGSPSGRTGGSSPALSVMVDTTPPAAPTVQPDMTTETDTGVNHSDNRTTLLKPTFNIGTLPAGVTPELVVDGVAVATSVSAPDAQGNVFLTPVNNISLNTHQLAFRYQDAAGNVSAASPALSMTILAEANVAELTAPVMTAQTDTGVSQSDAITSNPTPVFALGTQSPNAVIVLKVDGNVVEATQSTLDGETYLTPVNALSHGKHAITYTVQDNDSDTISTSPVLDVAILTQELFLSLNPIVTDGTLNANDVAQPLVISGTTNALVGATVTVTGPDSVTRTAIVAEPTVNRGSNTFSVIIPAGEIASISQGVHEVTATTTDLVNHSGSDTKSVNVDTQAPNTPLAPSVSENADGRISVEEAQDGTVATVSLTGTAAVVGDKVNVEIDGVVTSAVLTAQDITSNTVNVIIPKSVLDTAGQGSAVVKASITDIAGNTSASSPATTINIAGPNHAPTGNVTIAGTPQEGQTLSAANNLADADGMGAVSYQWFANGSAISGATGSNLTLNAAQVGKTISVKASYTDGQGFAELVASANTGSVSALPAPPPPPAPVNVAPTGSVTISGIAQEGQTLNASNNLADANGMGAVSYQWFANGAAISGATGSALTLGAAQIGKTISVKASYTDGQGFVEMVASANTGSVSALPAPVPVNTPATFGGDDTGTVTEDSTLTASGTLTVADVDANEASFQAAANLTGTYGAFTFNAANGQWTYALDNNAAAVQALAANATVTDTLTVHSADGTAHNIVVTINGADEPAPVNTPATFGGVDTGSVTEDGTLTASGTLTVADVDAGEASFQAATNLTGTYGAFTFNAANGQWTYALDNNAAAVQALAANATVTDTLTVHSADGTAHNIVVTINGADEPVPVNTPATFGGVDTGSVTEDGTLTASGMLTVADVDANEASFQAAANLAGAYGAFTFNAANGQWTYALDNNAAAVQALAANATVTDTLTVHSADGTAHNIVVTINGADEPLSIQITQPTAPATEFAAYDLANVFTLTDIDAGNSAITISLNPNANVDATDLQVSVGSTGVQVINVANSQPGYVYLSGTLAQLNAFLATPNAITLNVTDYSPPTTTTVRLCAYDQSLALIDNKVANITVDNVNNAPVVNSSTQAFVFGDAGVPDSQGQAIKGMALSDFLMQTQITDQDDNAQKGIAITGVSQGTLSYIDVAGTNTWIPVTGATDSNALLLKDSATIYLKFVPDNGVTQDISHAVTFRAWDQTAGTNGTYVDTSVNGGTSAFSTGVDYLSVGVPTLTVDTVAATFSNGHPTLSGTASPNGQVYIYDTNDVLYGVVPVDQNGVWTYTFNEHSSTPDFGEIDTTLAVGNYAFKAIAENANGIFSAPSQTISFGVTAPIVFDLNQDGVFTYSQEMIDVNDDGQREHSAWAGKDDGVLVWDKYADGQIHDNSQYAFAQYGGKTDLSGLAAAFDTNHDGQFNAQDAKFSEFAVWQDANQNGVSENAEVFKLTDLGVVSLNLSSDNIVRHASAGVTEYGQTLATLENGASMLVADAAFAYQSIKLDDLVQAPKANATPLLIDGHALDMNVLPAESSFSLASHYAIKMPSVDEELLAQNAVFF